MVIECLPCASCWTRCWDALLTNEGGMGEAQRGPDNTKDSGKNKKEKAQEMGTL